MPIPYSLVRHAGHAFAVLALLCIAGCPQEAAEYVDPGPTHVCVSEYDGSLCDWCGTLTYEVTEGLYYCLDPGEEACLTADGIYYCVPQ